MSTWQISSDAGDNIRWDQLPDEGPDTPPTQLPQHSLPSMSDLLRKGYSKMINHDENDGNHELDSPPMFRTGLGKSVVLKQSSISKASSILGDVADRGCSNVIKTRAGHSESPLIVQTELENSAVVKQICISKAIHVPHNEGGDMADDALLYHPSSHGCTMTMENGGGHLKSSSVSQNGIGKSSALKQSSISKPLPVLREGDAIENIASQLDKRTNGCSSANSMFRTGSGKIVNIFPSGLIRAKRLLGLEENHDHASFQSSDQMVEQSNSKRPFSWRSSPRLSTKMGVAKELKDSTSSFISPSNVKSGSSGCEFLEVTPDAVHSAPKPPSVKFQTASGRSVSVSSDALQRARNLLGDPELGSFLNERDAGEPVFSIFKDRKPGGNSNKESVQDSFVSLQETEKIKLMSKNFISPLWPTSSQKQSLIAVGSGKNLIRNFDAEVHENTGFNSMTCQLKSPANKCLHLSRENALVNGTCLRSNPLKRSTGQPLVDISNNDDLNDRSHRQITGVKRILGKRNSVSPFKRPRGSKFITPLTKETLNGSSTLVPKKSCYNHGVLSRYPFQAPRKYVKEYFGVPPCHINMLDQLPERIRRMRPETAEQYNFHDGYGFDSVGKEAFSQMLLQSGASMKHVSAKWVANHYKWIVWKLACYDRCYSRNFLSASNVLEELKYRYDREVNHGHRSAIKRILEGDVPPSLVLVLCISSIQSSSEAMAENRSTPHGVDNSPSTNIELTDGWYSMNAVLDVQLSKKLAAGKLFVGQKLKISGAGLCAWPGPVSPLEEASRTVSLVLNINGTYRAHWADRLGFCKSGAAALAFTCIKSNGGAVPSTYVGVQRIYPLLYRERLKNGGYAIRSEKMEDKMLQLYNQKCASVAEGIMSDFQKTVNGIHEHDDDIEEGAKILKRLETAAEPEILMAEMSSEQLNSLAGYQAKLEATRQSEVHKSVEKALEDAGLSEREVTPFMRVSVVGLISKSNRKKCCSRKGLITIWNPTEKQRMELLEGQAYTITGLIPLTADSDTLYLQARGSITKWLPLSPWAIEQFQPFFSPRKSVSLSTFGEIPLASEFDIAGVVIFVGEVHASSLQKKQWVFVTDYSVHKPQSGGPSNSLLAISFCSPYFDCDSYVPVNYNLAGSTVGFFNLIKRERDQINHLWVAEATENSTYSLTYDHIQCAHLKEAATTSEKWAKVSDLTIEKLKRKVLSIIDSGKR